MKKNTKDTIILLTIVTTIILAYLLSEKFLKQEPVTPQYQQHDQTNRLSKISQGLKK